MNQGRIHCIAHCRDCDWEEEDYNLAKREAYKHSRKNKHIVDVEEGYWFVYGDKK